MTNYLYATVICTVAGIYIVNCSVTVAAVDQPTAQTELNAIKAWFVAGGATFTGPGQGCTGTWQTAAVNLTS